MQTIFKNLKKWNCLTGKYLNNLALLFQCTGLHISRTINVTKVVKLVGELAMFLFFWKKYIGH